MKKLVVLVVLATISITFAQDKAISFGLRAGLNLNSATLERGSGSNSKENALLLDNNIGFHAGVIADIAITPFLYFQPGVMFSTKGGVISSEYEYENTYNDPFSGSHYEYEYSKETLTTNVYCIEVPIMLSLKAPLAEGLTLRANVGPYFDLGLSGKFKSEYESKYEENVGGNIYNEPLRKDSDSESIYPNKEKRMVNGEAFNFGIGVGGGLEFNSFYIGVNYLYGITNVLDVKEDYFEAYDRTLSITLGYNF